MSVQSEQTAALSSAGGIEVDPYRWHAIGLVSMFALTLPLIMGLGMLLSPSPPAHPWAGVAAGLGVEPWQISAGESDFKASCALCHGKDAGGIPRLGKPLRNSEYVQAHSDEELFQVIAWGRLPTDPENTTGAVMPARANQNLADDQLRSVITYLRAIQDPRVTPASMEDWIVATAQGGDATAGLVGGASGIGHDLFVASCSACHGPGGEGVDGLGKPLARSEFLDSKTDEELIKFVKTGRPIWDAENTTGVDMPAKGGNPALSDEQLVDIVEYIRALHASSD